MACPVVWSGRAGAEVASGEAWSALRSQVYLCQLTRIRLGHNDYRAVVVEEHRQMVELLERGEVLFAGVYRGRVDRRCVVIAWAE